MFPALLNYTDKMRREVLLELSFHEMEQLRLLRLLRLGLWMHKGIRLKNSTLNWVYIKSPYQQLQVFAVDLRQLDLNRIVVRTRMD